MVIYNLLLTVQTPTSRPTRSEFITVLCEYFESADRVQGGQFGDSRCLSPRGRFLCPRVQVGRIIARVYTLSCWCRGRGAGRGDCSLIGAACVPCRLYPLFVDTVHASALLVYVSSWQSPKQHDRQPSVLIIALSIGDVVRPLGFSEPACGAVCI